MKVQTILLGVILALCLFFGAFLVGYCRAEASPPGVWVCMAEATNYWNADYNCDATSRSTNKKKAMNKALVLCNAKCVKNQKDIKCHVSACARRR
jgi:hypothetical protein